MTSKKVIFCVHGKLSGCCTLIKGSETDDKGVNDYQHPILSKFSNLSLRHLILFYHFSNIQNYLKNSSVFYIGVDFNIYIYSRKKDWACFCVGNKLLFIPFLNLLRVITRAIFTLLFVYLHMIYTCPNLHVIIFTTFY